MKKHLVISVVFVFLTTILSCGGEEDCREATSPKEGYKCDTESGFWEKEKDDENNDNENHRTDNDQNNGNNNGNDEDNNGNNNGDGSQTCQYGTYKCQYDYSYYCGYSGDDLAWLIYKECEYGCDESTGQCNSNFNGNDDDEDSEECTAGTFKCAGSESHYCNTYGTWVFDARCDYGCDQSTGKCKTSADNGGQDQECSAGDYKCEDSYI